jgi:hypothetical protein
LRVFFSGDTLCSSSRESSDGVSDTESEGVLVLDPSSEKIGSAAEDGTDWLRAEECIESRLEYFGSSGIGLLRYEVDGLSAGDCTDILREYCGSSGTGFSGCD